VLQALLQALGPDCALVFVTHKMQLVGLVQRLMVVAGGRIVVDGPARDVMDKLRPAPARPVEAGVPRPVAAVKEVGHV